MGVASGRRARARSVRARASDAGAHRLLRVAGARRTAAGPAAACRALGFTRTCARCGRTRHLGLPRRRALARLCHAAARLCRRGARAGALGGHDLGSRLAALWPDLGPRRARGARARARRRGPGRRATLGHVRAAAGADQPALLASLRRRVRGAHRAGPSRAGDHAARGRPDLAGSAARSGDGAALGARGLRDALGDGGALASKARLARGGGGRRRALVCLRRDARPLAACRGCLGPPGAAKPARGARRARLRSRHRRGPLRRRPPLARSLRPRGGLRPGGAFGQPLSASARGCRAHPAARLRRLGGDRRAVRVGARGEPQGRSEGFFKGSAGGSVQSRRDPRRCRSNPTMPLLPAVATRHQAPRRE